MKTIVVVGAGKGMGNHIAEEFGKNNFRVALISRNQSSLDDYVREFTDKGIETFGFAADAADAADTASLTEAFKQIKAKLGFVDVRLYITRVF